MSGVPVRKVVGIFAVAVVPIDGRIMPGIGQRFIQRPETAYEPLCILGNRLGKISPLRRNSPDNGNGCILSTQRPDHPGPVVKL